MSRRHHGRSHQGGRYRHDPPRPAPGAAPAVPGSATGTPPASVEASAPVPSALQDGVLPQPVSLRAEAVGAESARLDGDPAPTAPSGPQDVTAASAGDGRPGPVTNPLPVNGHARAQAPGPGNGQERSNAQERSNGCTAPQLRRFIKSRPYVPMHELRRRFAIDGEDDEVTQVSINQGHVYVGLPSREGSLLGELLRGGDIGYELSLDPRTPVVIGVYPMRPVPRS
jgi:hypothetical protein